MAIRKILDEKKDDLLRKKSKVVTSFDEKLEDLLFDMKESMHKYDGCGLAAVQVGVLKRVIIIEANGMYMELVNPEIIEKSGSQIGVEGCLSVKGINGEVERPESVVVKAFDKTGEEITIHANGFLAVVLSHEIDHLDGILFIDKMIKRV